MLSESVRMVLSMSTQKKGSPFIHIESRQDVMRLGSNYRIVVFGFVFIRFLPEENIIMQKYPTWFRLSKWFLQKTCRHSLKKYGKPKIEGYFFGDYPTTMIQEVSCEWCAKKSHYKYKHGIYTD